MHSSHSVIRDDFLPFLPCGTLIIHGKLTGIFMQTWIINVKETFGVNVTIVKFSIDNICELTSLWLTYNVNGSWCAAKYFKVCGTKKIWYQLSPSNETAVVFSQHSSYKPAVIKLFYQVYNRRNYASQALRGYQSHFQYDPFSRGLLISNRVAYTILIKGLQAFSLGATVSYCFSSEIWTVYDGPSKNIKLVTLAKCPKKGHKTVYPTYQSVMFIYDSKDRLLSTIAIRWNNKNKVNMISIKPALVGETTTRIQHIGRTTDILNTVWKIDQTNMSNFVSLRLEFNKFHGYTGSKCIYGGFAFMYDITHIINTRQILEFGPYCEYRRADPLMGNKMTLSRGDTYLYVYAYSDFFYLDIEVVLSVDECEGVLNPCEVCLLLKQFKRRGYGYQGETFNIDCESDAHVSSYGFVFIRKRSGKKMCVRVQNYGRDEHQVCDVILNKLSTFGTLGKCPVFVKL